MAGFSINCLSEIGETLFKEVNKCEKTFRDICIEHGITEDLGTTAINIYVKRNNITSGKYKME